jgi:hypothetical protein
MENLAKRNKKTVDELFGEDQSKEFIIQIGGLRIRFVYDPCDLIDDWKHFSIHVYYIKYSWQWPWAKWNFHMAVRKKWPFIKIGFKNIYPKLYKGGGF